MDRSRAKSLGLGPRRLAAACRRFHAAGASVGGMSQMIGNVWEWTAEDFELPVPPRSRREVSRRTAIGSAANGAEPNETPVAPAVAAVNRAASAGSSGQSAAHQSNDTPRPPIKTLRGGAFDTYFDHHASCQFASGDSPLARKYNIGFRLAIGTCDLVALAGSHVDGESEANQTPADENAEDLQPA